MEVASPFHETEQFFYEKIPLTRAMGVKVEALDREKLILTAPLEENHNHLGTAFGGSLGALATLAGYGLLWLVLEDRDCHIVIRSSSISYERPVRGQLRAICRHPDESELADFKNSFEKKGKARIRLHVTIEQNDEVCVVFEGIFVAMR